MYESLMAAGIAIVALIVFLVLLFLAIGILLTVFWILMIVDCAKRGFKDSIEKVVWILMMILLGVIGSAVYYFAVKRPQDSSKAKKAKTSKR